MTVYSVPGQQSRIADPRGDVLSQGDWTWIRTSVFMRWSNCHDKDNASVILVVFSASPELRDRCQRLWDTELSGVLVDPFSLFVICLDELWLQAQSILKVVRDEFSKMERVSQFEGQRKPSREMRTITQVSRPPSTLHSRQRQKGMIFIMILSGSTTWQSI